MQIILPPAPIWFNKKIDLRKYITEKIPHSRIEKKKKDLVTGKKGYLIYKIKFTGRNECNAKQD